jgi:hypothetical protein
VGFRIVAWENGGGAGVLHQADVVVVDSASRKDELVARAGLDGVRLVTISDRAASGAEPRPEESDVTCPAQATAARRVYESLLDDGIPSGEGFGA